MQTCVSNYLSIPIKIIFAISSANYLWVDLSAESQSLPVMGYRGLRAGLELCQNILLFDRWRQVHLTVCDVDDGSVQVGHGDGAGNIAERPTFERIQYI